MRKLQGVKAYLIVHDGPNGRTVEKFFQKSDACKRVIDILKQGVSSAVDVYEAKPLTFDLVPDEGGM